MKIFHIFEMGFLGPNNTLMYMTAENEEIAEKKAKEIYPSHGWHLRLEEVPVGDVQKKVLELTAELNMYKDLLDEL